VDPRDVTQRAIPVTLIGTTCRSIDYRVQRLIRWGDPFVASQRRAVLVLAGARVELTEGELEPGINDTDAWETCRGKMVFAACRTT
jgi:hypothetical protein